MQFDLEAAQLRQPMPAHIDKATRRLVNDDAFRQFVSAWDPAWRWMLLLGLRELRKDPKIVGEVAVGATGSSAWREDEYLYGQVALGTTSTAVNETALHCEALFAFLKFAGEREKFLQRMTSYSAGQVTVFGKRLAGKSADEIRLLFFVPSARRLVDGLSDADDPTASAELCETGLDRLVTLTRDVVGAIEERKGSTAAPVRDRTAGEEARPVQTRMSGDRVVPATARGTPCRRACYQAGIPTGQLLPNS